MNDDVRQAAERLRLCLTVGGPDDPLAGVSAAYSESDGDFKNVACLTKDELTIVKAYLAEHPADDGEAVSEDWLRSVGLRDNRMVIEFMKLEDGRWASRWHGWELPRLKSRGQVRNLCAALGVELKESEVGK